MSVSKDFFDRQRDFNYDFQAEGAPATGWEEADRLPERAFGKREQHLA